MVARFWIWDCWVTSLLETGLHMLQKGRKTHFVNAWVTTTVKTDRRHHGLCRVLPPAGHVGREGEQGRPRCHGDGLLPTDAPGGLPQSDWPPLHVVLLWRGRLLRWHQLGQLLHFRLADGEDWGLTLSQWGHRTNTYQKFSRQWKDVFFVIFEVANHHPIKIMAKVICLMKISLGLKSSLDNAFLKKDVFPKTWKKWLEPLF